MSQYSVQVDQFLMNSLLPEIDALTLSLSEMEKYGYNNQAIVDTKRKLSKLVPIYDFLKEYAYGNEEAELDKLQRLMSIAGTSLLSPDTSQKIFPFLRSRAGLNNHYDLDYLRFYVDGEIVTNNLIVTSDEPRILDIYLPKKYKHISVTININGVLTTKEANNNYVKFTGIVVDSSTTYMTIAVVGQSNDDNVDDFIETITMDVRQNTCDSAVFTTYYVGSTTDHFTISTTDINESTDISIDPNNGSNQQGTKIDYNWVLANLEAHIIKEGETVDFTDRIFSKPGDAHLIVAFPSGDIDVTNIIERVLGMDAAMTQGLHWERVTLFGAPTNFSYIYFRDLANFEYTNNREIQFTIDV